MSPSAENKPRIVSVNYPEGVVDKRKKRGRERGKKKRQGKGNRDCIP